jgi:sec-independent protein translocase protein TatA
VPATHRPAFIVGRWAGAPFISSDGQTIVPFGLGLGELVLIVALLTLVFGAKRIPQIASGIGKGIRNFKTEVKESSQALPAPDEDEGRNE